MRDSLLARARRCPRSERPTSTGSPAKPDHPVQDNVSVRGDSGQRPLAGEDLGAFRHHGRQLVRPGGVGDRHLPGTDLAACSASSLTDDRAPSETTSNRPPAARTTSSAWVPMEPVLPAIETVSTGCTGAVLSDEWSTSARK